MDGDDQNPTTASISTTGQIKPNDIHITLAKAIHRHKNIIINPSSSIPRDKLGQEKERAWESIRLEMVNAGIQRFANRTWRTVRDVDWQHLRRRVVNKIAENIKVHQTADRDLNELDILVLDTLGKTNSDGSIDFSDLIKQDPLDEMPKSVSSDRSENNFEIDNHIVASTNSLLADMIEEYGTSNKPSKRANSSNAQNECTKKKACPINSVNSVNNVNTEFLNEVVIDPSNFMPNASNTSNETRIQWETFLREIGIGRKEEELNKETNPLEIMKADQERYKTEAEKYKSEQEKYKALQERWKAEIEKIRLEEAKIRLSRLKRE